MTTVEVDVCMASELGPGDLMLLPLARLGDRKPRAAIVLRDVLGELHAYLNRCEHLPIPLDAGSGRLLTPDGRHLVCQTHGALYRLRDGYCEAGPCIGAALKSFHVFERGGRIVLVDVR